eukprot:ANDGO_04016.mRNA.1 Protein N-terminal amidase
MKIGCVQFDARLGDVDANIRRVEELLQRRNITSGTGLTVLLFPELSLSGYCFSSKSEILPFAEHVDKPGKCLTYASDLAKRVGAFVAMGFVEIADNSQKNNGRRCDDATSESMDAELYNSMVLVDKSGKIVYTYRKSFLYETDESWALEGGGFKEAYVDGLRTTLSVAICMDINPYQFKAPFDAFEYANSLSADVRLVLFCTNWILSAPNLPKTPEEICDPEKNAAHLIQYLALRMKPVLGHPVVFCAANRVGTERGTRFAGASCIIDLKRRTILGHLDSDAEDVLIVDDVPLYP